MLLIISGHQWSFVAQKNNQACYSEQIIVCSSHSVVFIDNKKNKAYDQIYPLSINQRQRGTQADSSLQRLTEPRQRGQVSKLNTSIPAQHQQPCLQSSWSNLHQLHLPINGPGPPPGAHSGARGWACHIPRGPSSPRGKKKKNSKAR